MAEGFWAAHAPEGFTGYQFSFQIEFLDDEGGFEDIWESWFCESETARKHKKCSAGGSIADAAIKAFQERGDELAEQIAEGAPYGRTAFFDIWLVVDGQMVDEEDNEQYDFRF